MSGNGNGSSIAMAAAESLWHDVEDWSAPDDWWVRWLQQQTGVLADPYDHPDNPAGFDTYTAQLGIENFPAREVFRPAYPQRWIEHYGDRDGVNLGCKPARHGWPRLCCPLWLWQRIRWRCNRPIPLVSGWRPEPYNGGAWRSDHLWACAIDAQPGGLTAEGCSCWEAALTMLQRWFDGGTLSLSVGFYSDHAHPDIHIGVGAPRTMAKRYQASHDQVNDAWLVGRSWDYREPEHRRITLSQWRPSDQ